MSIVLGQKAPVFNVEDIFGRTINLESYGDRKVLVAFFRNAACPFCNLRVFQLLKESEKLKALGLEMIFFFESKKQVLLRSSFHREVSPIPLISDSEGIWYGKYGVKESMMGVVKTFLSPEAMAVKSEAKRMGVPAGGDLDGARLRLMPVEFLLNPGLSIEFIHEAGRLDDRISISRLYQFAKGEVLTAAV
ncbi:MAG: redoxin domain-containing protein [Cytophagales bacterium]|nr:redoxin domain-containing protein [Cytophagales bacterium]